MSLFVFSLFFILANVEGQNRAFTSFDSLFAPIFQGGSHRIQSPSHGFIPNFSSLRNSLLFHQPHNSLKQPTFGTGRNSIYSASGNLVQQSKALATSAKALFKSFENIKLVPELFDHVFETSGCLGNLEDVIEMMDASNKLILKNSPEIIYLEAIVDNLLNEKNVTKLMRSSAKILKILEDLVPKLTDRFSKICISSPIDSVEDFENLANLLIDVLNHRDIDLPEEQRQLIEQSSEIMKYVAKFIVTLNKSLEKFETIWQQ